jgi:hypothetical protein
VLGIGLPAEAIPAPDEPVATEPNTGLVAADVPPLSSAKSFTPGSVSLAPEVAGTPDASVGEVDVESPAAPVGKFDPATARLTGRDEMIDRWVCPDFCVSGSA